MKEKIVRKRKKLTKKQEEKRKLAKSLRNKQYYAKRKREKALKEGIVLPLEMEVTNDNAIKKNKRDFFLIVITSHKKVIEQVYHTTTSNSAFKKFNELIEENKKNVVFPVKTIANKNISRGLIKADYEILLIKRRKENDSDAKLRNEYGQFVDHVIVDNDKWVIVDKHIYNREESFWVYGFNPKTQRKNFNFILNEMILVNNDKNYFKRVIIFKNKLVIQYDFDIDIVICKNQEDAIRLYNALEEGVKKAKYKNIFFNGIVSNSNKAWAFKLIMDKTGWNKDKVRRSETKN